MPVVLAYHGCDQKAAQDLLSGSPFKFSTHNYDWLGTGAYFWEWDVMRAWNWAVEFKKDNPCIVGAALELADCLDLTTQNGTRAVKAAYDSYVKFQELRDEKILVNKNPKDRNPGDLALRYLDRAVITHLHESFKAAGIPEYDTLRALFPEGKLLYADAGFWENTHVQIAVRNIRNIRGIFRVPDHELEENKIPKNIYDF